jgi:hypothetical protein
MNIRLANVISEISGMTGQAILKAILDGQRDPRELAAYRDRRVEASEEEIAEALEGNWQEDQLFVLRQEQADQQKAHRKGVQMVLPAKFPEKLKARSAAPTA